MIENKGIKIIMRDTMQNQKGGLVAARAQALESIAAFYPDRKIPDPGPLMDSFEMKRDIFLGSREWNRKLLRHVPTHGEDFLLSVRRISSEFMNRMALSLFRKSELAELQPDGILSPEMQNGFRQYELLSAQQAISDFRKRGISDRYAGELTHHLAEYTRARCKIKRIPPYDEKHQQEFAHIKESMQAKFRRQYALPNLDNSLDSDEFKQFKEKVANYICDKQWDERCVKAGVLNRQVTLNPLARDIMEEYGNALFLRSQLFGLSPVNTQALQHQTDIYINHITLKALSRLKSAGLNLRQSFLLLSHCIHKSAFFYKYTFDEKICLVSPQIKAHPETEEEALKEIIKILDFGEGRLGLLNADNRRKKSLGETQNSR